MSVHTLAFFLPRRCQGRRLRDDDGIVPTRLFTHKADCERVNEQQLSALPGANTRSEQTGPRLDHSTECTLDHTDPLPTGY